MYRADTAAIELTCCIAAMKARRRFERPVATQKELIEYLAADRQNR
jgi:hypothetical protein